MTSHRRAAAAGLALSNLVLIQAWVLAGGSQYFSSGLPSTTMYAGLIAAWLLLGAVLTVIVKLADRGAWGMRLSAILITIVMLVPVDWLLRKGAELPFPVLLARWGLGPVLAVIALTIAVVLLSPLLQRLVVRVMPIVLLPMMVVTATHAFAPLVASPIAPPPASEKGPAAGDGVKVVWLMFDEMGQLLVKGLRPGAPPLPAFERLMSESFVADAVRPPSLRTLLAVPSIFTGRRVVSATPDGHDLVLRFDDGSRGAWSRQDSPFLRVRRAGLGTGMVGWLHAYCDTLPGQFDECAWRSYQVPPRTIAHAMREHYQEVVNEFSWPLRLALKRWLPTPAQAEEQRHYHAGTFAFVDGVAQRMLRASGPGLYLAHYPVPHPPGVLDIVDPEAPRMSGDLFANAVLADRALATLRRHLEADGTWERTVVVLTSDHSWREGQPFDARVPMVIKLGGGPSPAVYGRPLSTMLLHDLLPRLATGEIATTEALTRYLDGSGWQTPHQ